jgi:hypothetical protein
MQFSMDSRVVQNNSSSISAKPKGDASVQFLVSQLIMEKRCQLSQHSANIHEMSSHADDLSSQEVSKHYFFFRGSIFMQYSMVSKLELGR